MVLASRHKIEVGEGGGTGWGGVEGWGENADNCNWIKKKTQNRTESPQKDLCIYGKLVFNKSAKDSFCRKDSLTSDTRTTGYLNAKKEVQLVLCTIYKN